MAIPKIIHQVWLQGADEVPERFLPFRESWRVNHPNWELRLWDDNSIEALLFDRFPWFIPTYRGYKHLIQRVDAGRYFVLYEFGGFSVDLDMRSVRPLDELTAQYSAAQMIVSKLPFTMAEGRLLKPILGTNLFYTNAVVGTTPHFHVWEPLLHSLEHTQRRLRFSKLLNVMASTGPAFFSRQIEPYVESEPGIVALHERFFESGFGFDPDREISEDAFAEHLQEASWHTDTLRFIFNTYFRIKNGLKKTD